MDTVLECERQSLRASKCLKSRMGQIKIEHFSPQIKYIPFQLSNHVPFWILNLINFSYLVSNNHLVDLFGVQYPK